MTDYLTDITGQVRTTDQRVVFLQQLAETERSFFMTNNKDGEKSDKMDQKRLRELREVKNWPEIRLRVARELDSAGIVKISDWLRREIKPNLLIDFQIDVSLGAGAVIDYKGKVKDYTIKKMLESEGAKYGI